METVLLTKAVISAKHKPFQQADFRGRGLHKISNFPFSRKTQTPGQYKLSRNKLASRLIPEGRGWVVPPILQPEDSYA